jgi:hypothetical protein
MPLSDTADGRIAAHRAQGFEIVGQQQCAATHTRSGQRGFGSGMATADDDDIKVSGVGHLQ